MAIPCKDCLVLPLCKNKQYRIMVEECDLIRKLLYSETFEMMISDKLVNVKVYTKAIDPTLRVDDFHLIICKVEKIMNPNTWSAGESFGLPAPNGESIRNSIQGYIR